MKMISCQWCGQKSEHLVKLYEVHGKYVSDPLPVCREHLIPGKDPCPEKLYELIEEGDQIRRKWYEGEELKQAIERRLNWFHQHPGQLDHAWSNDWDGNMRYSWFEDHPNEITR